MNDGLTSRSIGIPARGGKNGLAGIGPATPSQQSLIAQPYAVRIRPGKRKLRAFALARSIVWTGIGPTP